MSSGSRNFGGSTPDAGDIISAGVDWITATTCEREKALTVMEEWAVWLDTYQKMGGEAKKRSRLGYLGFEAQGVFVGSREDGAMVQASGWAADIWYTILGMHEWHPTRIDLQVTGVVGGDGETFYQKQCANAVETRGIATRGRPRKITGIQGYGDGDTLAVGARTSSQYGRLYDKHAETPSEYPKGAWRWEVEYKAAHAEAVMEALMEASDKRAAAVHLVKEFYLVRGVEFPFAVTELPIELHVGRIETSDEKSLNWLAKHVRPTVARLVKRGKREQVLKALNLTE